MFSASETKAFNVFTTEWKISLKRYEPMYFSRFSSMNEVFSECVIRWLECIIN